METACIEWTRGKDMNGYGKIRIKGKQYYAHRIIYEREIGLIPKGLVIDHLCRNTSCVNTKHLEPCSIHENLQREKDYLFSIGKLKSPRSPQRSIEERRALRKIYMKEWEVNNPRKLYHREWREKNRERVRTYFRNWYNKRHQPKVI